MSTAAKQAFAILLLVLGLSGCNLVKDKNPVCGSWKLVPNDEAQQQNTWLTNEFHYAYLRLYNNGEYTFLSPQRSAFGQWALNPKDSVLTVKGFNGASNLLLAINSANGGWLRGNLTYNQTHTPFLFKNDPYFEYKDADLLLRSSNTWRIKPNHKESHQEIRNRVIAHIDYMRSYFKIVQDDERPAFQTGFMHTPVRYYQNAIGVANENDLPDTWINCFYDADDAKEGARLIAQAIQSMNSYPEGTKTFTEGYYKALGEMKDYLVMLK